MKMWLACPEFCAYKEYIGCTKDEYDMCGLKVLVEYVEDDIKKEGNQLCITTS